LLSIKKKHRKDKNKIIRNAGTISQDSYMNTKPTIAGFQTMSDWAKW
jgi:hypothetical protein